MASVTLSQCLTYLEDDGLKYLCTEDPCADIAVTLTQYVECWERGA